MRGFQETWEQNLRFKFDSLVESTNVERGKTEKIDKIAKLLYITKYT